jgi:septin family protein
MVCGPKGSGKSSFIDLFIRKFNFKDAEQLIKQAENKFYFKEEKADKKYGIDFNLNE